MANGETQHIGTNVQAHVEGTKLIIEVDLSKNYGLSSSGKMYEVANSGGFQVVRTEGTKRMKLNLYLGYPANG